MNKLLRNVRPQKLIKILEGLGFEKYKAKSSHVRLKHADSRWTQVAVHPRPIPSGTLRKILNQIKLTGEELEKLL